MRCPGVPQFTFNSRYDVVVKSSLPYSDLTQLRILRIDPHTYRTSQTASIAGSMRDLVEFNTEGEGNEYVAA